MTGVASRGSCYAIVAGYLQDDFGSRMEKERKSLLFIPGDPLHPFWLKNLWPSSDQLFLHSVFASVDAGWLYLRIKGNPPSRFPVVTLAQFRLGGQTRVEYTAELLQGG